MRVCLVIEGSYPYITGGVSSWIHELIGGLPEVEFVLFTLSPSADQELRYALPPNVVGQVDIPLGKRPPKSGARRGKKGGGDEVRAALSAHLRMFAGEEPDLADFLGSIPERHSLHRDAVLDKRAWSFVGAQNRARNPLYPFSDYFWAWKGAHDLIFNLLAAEAPEADLYHSVSTGFAGLAALAAKVRKGKPFLLTEHGLYHKEREIEIRKATFVKGYQRDLWSRIYDRVASLCYSNADLCTSLFAENRRYQLDLGAKPENALVIPNGIDIERFSVERAKIDERFHVGFVGRVVPIKDVKTYILAAKLLIDRLGEGEREVIFHIIGPEDEDPEYAAACRRLAADLKIEGRIEFTGRKDVRDYYRFLDVVVLTSVREAQPLVILEAYAAGIPVVSTDVGNVSELLEGDRRFIAPVKDAEGIAEGIRYVFSHPQEMAELAERNRARAIADYDKKELLARYGELYARFAPAGVSSPPGKALIVAGIGFELRKLVETRTLRGFFGATFSGLFIVAGPWLVSTASIAAVQRLPFLVGTDAEAAFTGAMVWAFALSLGLGTGPLYAYVRLSADLLFEHKRGEAGTALAKSVLIVALVSFGLGLGLSFFLVRDCPYMTLFRLAFASLLAALGALWLATMTVTVLRRFGRIILAYAAGMLLLVGLAAVLGPRYGAAGGVAALAAGYALTVVILIGSTLASLGRASFPDFARKMRYYLRRYRNLIIAGAAYALGIWADKVILWAFRGSAAPGTAFFIFSPYDSAFFYANLSLIPGLVYYTLATETDFHLELMRFLVFLIRRPQPEVEAARIKLARGARRNLWKQSFFQSGVVAIALILAAPPLRLSRSRRTFVCPPHDSGTFSASPPRGLQYAFLYGVVPGRGDLELRFPRLELRLLLCPGPRRAHSLRPVIPELLRARSLPGHSLRLPRPRKARPNHLSQGLGRKLWRIDSREN